MGKAGEGRDDYAVFTPHAGARGEWICLVRLRPSSTHNRSWGMEGILRIGFTIGRRAENATKIELKPLYGRQGWCAAFWMRYLHIYQVNRLLYWLIWYCVNNPRMHSPRRNSYLFSKGFGHYGHVSSSIRLGPKQITGDNFNGHICIWNGW